MSQFWRSWITQGALRNPLIILMHLDLAVKLCQGFGERTCPALKDCYVSRIVTAEQFVRRFALPHRLQETSSSSTLQNSQGLWDYLSVFLGNGFSKTCLEYLMICLNVKNADSVTGLKRP